MNMTARFKAYRDLNREIDLQIERLEQMEAKAGSPSTPNLSGMQEQIKLLFNLAIYTGLRKGELLALSIFSALPCSTSQGVATGRIAAALSIRAGLARRRLGFHSGERQNDELFHAV